jgi:integrase/recombinase XerD
MASLKLVLRKNQSADGSFPLTIRITKNRKTSWLYLNTNLFPDQWDAVKQKVRKSHPNSTRLNNFLSQKLAEASNKVLELETEKSDASARALKQKVKPSGGATFFGQAEVYLSLLKSSGKYNRESADKPRIERFREFLKGEDIAFSDITVTLLERFKGYLRSTRQISERTVVNHLVVIRSVFSQAINDKITDKKYYPFGKGQIVIKFPDSHKIGFEAHEVEAIEKLQLESPALHHARNVWLISYYFAGARVSDTLRLLWSEIQNGRLYYKMGKNGKVGSLKVPTKAMAILDQYKRPDPVHDLIFPDLEGLPDLKDRYAIERRIKTRLKAINGNLADVAEAAKITKPLTMHISRHTFGNISGDKIPVQMLQKLYRHSHISTTIGYQSNFIHKDHDEALAAVIGE